MALYFNNPWNRALSRKDSKKQPISFYRTRLCAHGTVYLHKFSAPPPVAAKSKRNTQTLALVRHKKYVKALNY